MIALSAETAIDYLRTQSIDASEARELGGGVSNIVVRAASDRGDLVLKQALPQLRVAEEWLADQRRIFQECEAIRALSALLPKGSVPDVVFEDRDNFIFAMSAAPASAVAWKDLLLAGSADSDLAAESGRLLGALVSASWRSPEWESRFADYSHFQSLRIDPYYQTIAARHPAVADKVAELIEATTSTSVALVHGDYSPKNFLVDPSTKQKPRLMLIDFEVIHFGDPSFDAAFLLNHFLLKSFYRTDCSAAYVELAGTFWRTYRECLPPDAGWMESMTIHHLGCLMLARIDGKSPVEYLKDEGVRDRVRRRALDLIASPPESIDELLPSFSAAYA